MEYCLNCGCKKFSNFCTNCDEEVFIVKRYDDLKNEGIEINYPDKDSEFMKKYNNSIKKKNEKNN